MLEYLAYTPSSSLKHPEHCVPKLVLRAIIHHLLFSVRRSPSAFRSSCGVVADRRNCQPAYSCRRDNTRRGRPVVESPNFFDRLSDNLTARAIDLEWHSIVITQRSNLLLISGKM